MYKDVTHLNARVSKENNKVANYKTKIAEG